MNEKKFINKNVSVKYLYLISVIVILLIFIGLYETYAMFTASVGTENIVNLIAGTTYDYTINGANHFVIGAGSFATFNVAIDNTTNGTIHYEIFHHSNDQLNDVLIAELIADSNITVAPNTSGILAENGTKTVPLVIKNEGTTDVNITIGVTSGFVGETITYGSNGYPNGTLITSVYDEENVISSTSCVSDLPTKNGNNNNNLDQSGANSPMLADGMLPIMYNGTNWVKADKNNEDSTNKWYDYNNKLWANAVMLTDTGRNLYKDALVGTIINETYILAYFVWIPRYRYKLFNTSFTSISTKSIEIEFEKITDINNGTCSYYNNPTNDCYYSHPAFWWDNDSDGLREENEELSGIWVSKFQVSSDISCNEGTNDTLGNGCNKNTINPKVLPNIESWRGAQVSTFYTVIRKFGMSAYLTTEGTEQVDAHMIKNMEWGAVAYLSHSIYGKNSEITNDSNNTITGGGNYKNNGSQSTTGNITGIYDMSGSAYEYVMGVIQDNTNTFTPMSGQNITNNSGFTGKLYYNASWQSTYPQYTGIDAPDKKYYSIYQSGTSNTNQTAYNRSLLGDATGETRKWYSDEANFAYTNGPWFRRGGNGSSSSSGIFAFGTEYGQSLSYATTRATLIINESR